MLIRENYIWLPNDVIANGVACHAATKLLQFYINIYCCDVTEDENYIWLPNDVIANGVACHVATKLLQFYINIYCCDVTRNAAEAVC
jgi:hypothetical protein